MYAHIGRCLLGFEQVRWDPITVHSQRTSCFLVLPHGHMVQIRTSLRLRHDLQVPGGPSNGETSASHNAPRGLGRPLQLARPDARRQPIVTPAWRAGRPLRRVGAIACLGCLLCSRVHQRRVRGLCRSRCGLLAAALPSPPPPPPLVDDWWLQLHSALWGSSHSLSDPCSQLTNPAGAIFETRSHFSRCYPAGHARIRPLFRNRASNPTPNNKQNEPAPSQLTGAQTDPPPPNPPRVSSRNLQPTEVSASLRETQPDRRAFSPGTTPLSPATDPSPHCWAGFYLRARVTHQAGQQLT